jgi:hypothetical protein
MERKRRVFLIDHASLQEMQDDLASAEQMSEYWNNTGDDVQTYWISVDDFNEAYHYPLPPDLVLFDNTVVITYDELHRTLSFDVLTRERENNEQRFFRLLDEQIAQQRDRPFRRIDPPARPRMTRSKIASVINKAMPN